MGIGLIVQLCAALAVLALGVMLVAVGSLVPGLVLTVGGGVWTAVTARRM